MMSDADFRSAMSGMAVLSLFAMWRSKDIFSASICAVGAFVFFLLKDYLGYHDFEMKVKK